MRKILNYLKSIKLTLTLLIIIIFLSVLGTLIPQNIEKWRYVEVFGHHGYAIIKYCQLQDVYHSWWYLGILCLLSLNILSCLISKIRAKNRNLIDKLANFKLYQNIIINKTIRNIENIIRDKLNNIKYKVTCKEKGNGVWHIYGEKGRLNKAGHFFTHISLLLILFGGLIGSLWGYYRDYLKITVGETVDIPGGNFKIRADNFEIKYYPNSSKVSSYESKLTVMEKGKEVLAKTIKVNHPLKYKGYGFYQSSYGTSKLGIKITNKKGKSEYYLIGIGKKIKLGESNLYFKVEKFLPDLVVEGTRIYSKSQDLNNPAARVSIYREKENLTKSFWLFYKYPDYHRNLNWNNEEMEFKLVDMQPYTELQVVKDRGLFLVYPGFLLLMTGIIFSLFIPFRKIYVILEKNNREIKIEIAGVSSPKKREMEDEFYLIAKEIADIE